MNTKIKITVELAPEEYEPIKKMAEHCATNVARIVEALVAGQAESGFLKYPGGQNWLSITGHLRETEGTSRRVEQIEAYIQACSEHGNLPSVEGREAASFGQLDSLEAFLAWKRGYGFLN